MAIGHWRPVPPCDVAACLLGRAAVSGARPEDAPARYGVVGLFEMGDYQTWAEVSADMDRLFAKAVTRRESIGRARVVGWRPMDCQSI